MNVKQKFFALAGIAGLIMAIVSGIGYFTASSAVYETTEEKIVSIIHAENNAAEACCYKRGSWVKALLLSLPNCRLIRRIWLEVMNLLRP